MYWYQGGDGALCDHNVWAGTSYNILPFLTMLPKSASIKEKLGEEVGEDIFHSSPSSPLPHSDNTILTCDSGHDR